MADDKTPLIRWGASVTQDQVQIRQTGRPFTLPRSSYLKTNHYIKQSRSYFPRHNLFCYFYLRCLEQLVCLFFLLSFFGVFGGYFTMGTSIACLLCLAVLAQHESVSQQVLPVILHQAVFPWQKDSNAFYTIEVSRTQTMAAGSLCREGMGFVRIQGRGMQFQAFNEFAVSEIKRSRRKSRAFFFLFLLLSTPYNLYFLLHNIAGQLSLVNVGLLFALT